MYQKCRESLLEIYYITNEQMQTDLGHDKVYPQLIETMTTTVSLEVYLLFLMLLSFSFTLSYFVIVGWHAFSFIVRQLKIYLDKKCKKKKKSQWLKISISFPLKMSRCILMWQVNSLIFTIKKLSYVAATTMASIRISMSIIIIIIGFTSHHSISSIQL